MLNEKKKAHCRIIAVDPLEAKYVLQKTDLSPHLAHFCEARPYLGCLTGTSSISSSKHFTAGKYSGALLIFINCRHFFLYTQSVSIP